MKRALISTAAVAATALVGSVLVAPASTAAPVCPAALKSVVGGSGDAFSNGLDDGAKGEDAEYVGGEIVLQLDPSANRRQLECIADELQADIIQGGIGKRGLAGIDNTAILLLRPGRSVIKTVNLLNRGRFSNLVLHAEPNVYIEAQAVQLPNDPMLPYQWGVINQGWAPKNTKNLKGTEVREPLGPQSTVSMRLPQLWDYMRRGLGVTAANPAGSYDRINVAVVDNSYFEHPDLVANSDLTKGGMVFGFGDITLSVKSANAAENYRIEMGTLPPTQPNVPPRLLRTCDLSMTAGPQKIADAITRSVDDLCQEDDVLIYDIVNKGIIGLSDTAGTFELRYGNQKVGDYAPVVPVNTIRADLSRVLNGANVSVTPISFGPLTEDTAEMILRIMVPAQFNQGISVDGANLAKTDVKAPASTVVKQPDAAVATETQNISAADQANGVVRQFKISYTPPLYLAKRYNRFFTIPDAKPVDIVSLARKVVKMEGDWPGRIAPKPGYPFGGTHGEFVAGIIGATANNGIGMTGAIGINHNIKMYGLVPASYSMTEIAQSLRVIDKSNFDTHVVNLSLGAPNLTKITNTDSTKEDALDADLLMRQISSVSDNSKTLFVIAAGNEGGNINDQNVRNDKSYKGQSRVAGSVCRPKGHGVTVRPANGGQKHYFLTTDDKKANTNRQTVTKGGTLNFLKMPDGTFDRGNMLCVGSVDWRGKPSTFSNWGRGVVDVAAPGSNLVGLSNNDGYQVESGTSGAAPMVAGVAALVYSSIPDRWRRPWLVKCAILSSATTQPIKQLGDLELQQLPTTKYENTFDAFGEGFDNDPRAGYSTGAGPHQFGPKGEMFTVNGIVNGQLAVGAAKSLVRKMERGATATCVQQRTFFGGWKNTRTQ